MEIFLKELWRRELDELLKPSIFYPVLKEKKIMKVFHYDDVDVSIPSKRGEFHSPTTKVWWGNIYTNRATRTYSKYAWYFDPKGKRANCLTRDGYHALAEMSEHFYPEVVFERTLNGFIDKIPALTKFQAHRLLKCLVDGRNSFITSSTESGIIDARKGDSWLHVLLKEEEDSYAKDICPDDL